MARQQQIHRLRHVITQLANRLPEKERQSPEVRELSSWGCRTTMHAVRLLAPRLAGENHMKDIDFTPRGVHGRREAGYADAKDVIAQAPWTRPVDPLDGVVLHVYESKQKMA